MHRPDTAQTDHHIEDTNTRTPYEEPLHLVEQPIHPRPAQEQGEIGQHKGPYVTMERVGEGDMVCDIVHFFTQILSLLYR